MFSLGFSIRAIPLLKLTCSLRDNLVFPISPWSSGSSSSGWVPLDILMDRILQRRSRQSLSVVTDIWSKKIHASVPPSVKGWLSPSRTLLTVDSAAHAILMLSSSPGTWPSSLCNTINLLLSNLMSTLIALSLHLEGEKEKIPYGIPTALSKGLCSLNICNSAFLQAGGKGLCWQNQFYHVFSMSHMGDMTSHFRIWGYLSPIIHFKPLGSLLKL